MILFWSKSLKSQIKKGENKFLVGFEIQNQVFCIVQVCKVWRENVIATLTFDHDLKLENNTEEHGIRDSEVGNNRSLSKGGARTGAAVVQFTVHLDSKNAIPLRVSYGNQQRASPCKIIYYIPPKSLQYYCLQPLVLDLKGKPSRDIKESLQQKVLIHSNNHEERIGDFIDLDLCLNMVCNT